MSFESSGKNMPEMGVSRVAVLAAAIGSFVVLLGCTSSSSVPVPGPTTSPAIALVPPPGAVSPPLAGLTQTAAIFVNSGTLTTFNSGATNISAAGGQAFGSAINGTSDATPVFNFAGTVNGSTVFGPVASALTGSQPQPTSH